MLLLSLEPRVGHVKQTGANIWVAFDDFSAARYKWRSDGFPCGTPMKYLKHEVIKMIITLKGSRNHTLQLARHSQSLFLEQKLQRMFYIKNPFAFNGVTAGLNF